MLFFSASPSEWDAVDEEQQGVVLFLIIYLCDHLRFLKICIVCKDWDVV